MENNKVVQQKKKILSNYVDEKNLTNMIMDFSASYKDYAEFYNQRRDFNKKFVQGFEVYVHQRGLYKDYDETMKNNSVFYHFNFGNGWCSGCDPFQWPWLLHCIKQETKNTD